MRSVGWCWYETWFLGADVQNLEAFGPRCLLGIDRIGWDNRVSDVKGLIRIFSPGHAISSLVGRLRWLGYVLDLASTSNTSGIALWYQVEVEEIIWRSTNDVSGWNEEVHSELSQNIRFNSPCLGCKTFANQVDRSWRTINNYGHVVKFRWLRMTGKMYLCTVRLCIPCVYYYSILFPLPCWSIRCSSCILILSVVTCDKLKRTS